MPNTREKPIEQKLKNGAESICDKCFHGKVCRAIDNQPYIECNQFTDANGVTIDKDINVPSKWVSVKDRLPEMYKNVLVIRTDGKIRFDAIGSLNVWYEEVWHTGNPVTHWMPLPAPPKGE